MSLIIGGLVAYALALPGVRLGGVELDAHTLAFGSLFILMGYQAVTFALLAKTYAIAEGFLPFDPRVHRFYQVVPLERGLMLAFAAGLVGLGLLSTAIWNWMEVGFGGLDYAHNMRLVIPGMTLVSLAFQSMLFGFMASIFGMKKN
jgi:hypothetical protein